MANKTITAFFDHYDDASDAVRRLEQSGIADGDISLIANNEGDRYSHHAGRPHGGGDTHADDGAGAGATLGTLAGGGAGLLAGLGLMAIPGLGPVVAAGWLVSTLVGAGAGAAAGGLAGALIGSGVEESDAHAYAEGVRRGGALVTVRARETEVDRIVDILDDEGTVDLEERQQNWRSEGWMGHNTGIGAAASTTTGMTTDLMDADRGDARLAGTEPEGMTWTGADSQGDRPTSMRDGRDEVIPVVEEELRVGKRDVGRGRVRIHSHVVERPVNEQVLLREDHVEVEHRPVDVTMRSGPMNSDELFRERTIEMDERAEEAVVSKETRVREELVVRKDVAQRTETVSDTVRRTEVEVDDDRGNRITGSKRDGT